jgi:serine/threonine protein kinase
MERISQVDHYQIRRKLAAGGNAKVKLAIDTRTSEFVALKVMKEKDGTIPQACLAQYRSEVQALNILKHPHIVRISGASECAVYKSKSGQEFQIVYIALELLPNGELFDIISCTGRMEAPLARVYFRQILDAVDCCHGSGITHRDIKIENILFDEHFDLKLADFGFAAPARGRDGSGYLHTTLGTLGYQAPELINGHRYSGISTDLFACGVVLFILISGHPPFAKASKRDSYYRLFRTNNGRFWSLHSCNKPQDLYNSEMQELINGMLAYKPSHRFTLQQVLASPWINGTSLSAAEARVEVAQRHARSLHQRH